MCSRISQLTWNKRLLPVVELAGKEHQESRVWPPIPAGSGVLARNHRAYADTSP